MTALTNDDFPRGPGDPDFHGYYPGEPGPWLSEPFAGSITVSKKVKVKKGELIRLKGFGDNADQNYKIKDIKPLPRQQAELILEPSDENNSNQ